MATDEGTPTKPAKSEASPQIAPMTPAYPDWSGYQALYGAGAGPTFFPSTVPFGHQHHPVPHFGVYPAAYPPGVVYVHPNMPMVPRPVNGNAEPSGKDSDEKDQGLSRKLNDATQSDCGSEGPSEASDGNNTEEFSATKKRNSDKIHVGAVMLQKDEPGPVSAAPSGTPSDQQIQDELERRKLKRKQSNRESARRSRQRKQAECKELQERVDMLNTQNHSLSDELQRLSEECEHITSENDNIREDLVRMFGPEIRSKIEERLQSLEDGHC